MSTLDPAGARAHLARRATTVQQSAVRDVFDIAMDPDLVSLAGGNPWLSGLPLEELGATAQRLIAQQGTASLQYGPGQGLESMRAVTLALTSATTSAEVRPCHGRSAGRAVSSARSASASAARAWPASARTPSVGWLVSRTRGSASIWMSRPRGSRVK